MNWWKRLAVLLSSALLCAILIDASHVLSTPHARPRAVPTRSTKVYQPQYFS